VNFDIILLVILFLKRDLNTGIYRVKTPWGHRGRRPSTNQGARTPKKPTHWYLDIRLLASKIMRKYISVVKPPICGISTTTV
jgi:hypothetical protein